MARLLLLIPLVLFISCSTPEIKPDLSIIKSETKKTKIVRNILIAPTTGTDVSIKVQKNVSKAMFKTYGTRAQAPSSLKPFLKTIGAPESTSDILLASYQAKFIKLTKRKSKKTPTRVRLPSTKVGFKVPRGVKGAKLLGKKLSRPFKKDKRKMLVVNRLNKYIFDSLNITYLLLSHVTGTKEEYSNEKPTKLSTALINTKTGRIRLYSTAQTTKAGVLSSYLTSLTDLSETIFDEIEEKDPLPDPPEDE